MEVVDVNHFLTKLLKTNRTFIEEDDRQRFITSWLHMKTRYISNNRLIKKNKTSINPRDKSRLHSVDDHQNTVILLLDYAVAIGKYPTHPIETILDTSFIQFPYRSSITISWTR